MNDMHRGRFLIPMQTINDRPEEARLMLRDSLVVRAEMMAFRDGIEYAAINPAFREINEAEEIPWYLAVFQRNEDGTITFKEWQEMK